MGVAIGEQAFNVLLRFVVDKKTLNDIENGTTSLQEALVGMEGAGQSLAVSAYRLQPALDAQIKKTAELQNAWWKTQRVLRATSFVFNEMAIAGAAMVAPLVAVAVKFAAEAKKTEGVLDPVAEKWLGLEDSLKKSALSVGKTTASVLMPALELAAELADKGAKFVEKNPDIIEAALKIGAAVATVGILGKLVTDGVKFFVDAKFVIASAQNVLAGQLMVKAARDNLLAALAMDKANPALAQDIVLGQSALSKSGSASMAALGAAGTTVLVGAIALAVGSAVGKAIGNAGGRKIYGEDYKDRNIGDAATTAFRIASLPGQFMLKQLNEWGIVTDKFTAKIGGAISAVSKWMGTTLGTEEAAEDATAALLKLNDALKGSEHEAEIVAAYSKMVEEDAKAAAEYAKDVEKINGEARSNITKAAAKLQDDLGKIHRDLNKDIQKINTDAANDQRKDDIKFAQSQAQTVRDSNNEIVRLRQDHQRELQKLEMAHNRTINKLVGERDALGIVEEDRRYRDEVALANQSANEEITRRRQDIAIKLADQRQEYLIERSQRIAETAAKIKEAQEKAKQDAIERRAQFVAERKEILANRAQALKELRDQYDQERVKRREAFIATVRDLDANLLGERNLKLRWYSKMLAEADAFLAAYKKKLPTAATGSGSTDSRYAPKATGNYVSGNIHTGEEGEEFLLTRRSTKIAEQAIGSRLTQDKLTQGLLGGGNQTIQIITGGGVTIAQVKRMLRESNNLQVRDLAHALGA